MRNITRSITVEQFNEKYKDKGGYAKLHEMVSELRTYREIYKYFEVSRLAVRNWTVRFYGKRYDPRPLRRERRIQFVLDFMKNHTLDESIETFKYENGDYFREAVFLAEKEGIYPESGKAPEDSNNSLISPITKG